MFVHAAWRSKDAPTGGWGILMPDEQFKTEKPSGIASCCCMSNVSEHGKRY